MTNLVDTESPPTIEIPLANVRWENYALAVAAGYNSSEACRRAGYSFKNSNSLAGRLNSYEPIRRRVAELRAIALDASIMSIVERKQRLSEIGRAKLKDYHNEAGVLSPFGEDVPNQGALAEVAQEYDPLGIDAFPTKIKLHDPTKAIDLLNKMEGSYPPASLEVSGRGGKPIEVRETRERLLGIIARLSIRAGETGDSDESQP